MLDEVRARERILETLDVAAGERLPLDRALGRFAAEELRAVVAVPGFDNSAMDGYAVRAGEGLPAGTRLKVLEGSQPAGRERGLRIADGEALRLFTGAPLPGGADAVVMQEEVTVSENGRELVLDEAVARGEFVRRAGSDLCVGQVVLRGGDRITAARCGVLASQGWETVQVGGLPTVTVVTTGDELRPAGGEGPGPGELYNSNGPMLVAMVREVVGSAASVAHRHAADDGDALAAVLGEAIGNGRVVIVSGGVSVGEHDLVRPVLAGLGVAGEFWRVRVKPGKPFYFGRHESGSRVFGLPGNPVSSFVTFLLFVAPALRRIMGASTAAAMPPSRACRLDADSAVVENPGDRPHYVRGLLDESTGTFVPKGLQQSHALFGLCQSNGLLRVEAGGQVRPGEWARAIPF